MKSSRKYISNKLTQVFFVLGEEIRKKWGKFNFSEDAFVKIAAEELHKIELHKYFTPKDILDIAIALNDDPILCAHQVDASFGDLQLVTYQSTKFFIEVLYWCDGPTSIHDHGFSGAFSVLSGSSINSEFIFTPKNRINHHFCIGDLFQRETLLLQVGDVREIYSGQRLIHSVFHMENPTITVVIRTFHDDVFQYTYRGERIRILDNFSPSFMKRIQGLKFIGQTNHPDFFFMFKEIFLRSSIDERYWLFRELYPFISRHLKEFDQSFYSSFEKNTQLVIDAVYEDLIIDGVMKLRAQLKETDIRYFLALLLNLPSWTDITQFIKIYHQEKYYDFIEKPLQKLKTLGYSIPIISSSPLNSIRNNKNKINLFFAEALSFKGSLNALIEKRIQATAYKDALKESAISTKLCIT